VSLPAIVLAGGLGTRLREVTGDRMPKPMVPVPLAGASYPFLEFVLAHLRAQGIVDIIICIGHLGDAIRRHFGDGRRFGLNLVYSDAGAALTATRVMRAMRVVDQLRSLEFLVVCADTYHPLDVSAFIGNFRERPRWLIQLAVIERDGEGAANVAIDDDGTVTAYRVAGVEAARRAGLETGTLAVSRDALAGFDTQGDLSLTDDVYPALIGRRAVGTWDSGAPFFDIGTPDGYRRFCQFAAQAGVAPLSAASR
jgi:mannose-1-phosphate guanylyltransferase